MAIILNSPVQGKNDVPSVAGSPVSVKSYTTAQVNALTGQDPGTIVWDSDVIGHKVYSGSAWVQVSSATTWMAPVRTAANLNAAPPLQNGGAYGGVTVADGDRVLIIANLFDQTTNGIWVVNTAGLWTRPTDFQSGGHATASAVFVQEGTGPASKRGITYICNTPPPSDIIDTNQTDWIPIAIGGRETSPGTVVYDDNSAGGGISTTNVGTTILSYGSGIFGLLADLGGYGRIIPLQNYSYLGVPAPVYHALGESSIRQMGSIQFDYPLLTPTPVIASATNNGTNNGVTRGYKVVARGAYGPGQFSATDNTGFTAASAQVLTAADGPTALFYGTGDTVDLVWGAVAGARSYDIYLTFSSVGETLGRVIADTAATMFTIGQQVADPAFPTPPTIATARIDTINGSYQVVTPTQNIGLEIVNGGGGFPVSGTGTLQAQTITVAFRQDGTGGWVISTPPGNVRFAGGTMATLSAAADAIDVYTLRWDATLIKWVEQSRALGL